MTVCMSIQLSNSSKMCRYVFLTNQRIETPSTWSHSIPDLADAEEAGATNYQALGCHWASKESSDVPEASGTSSASTATAAGATTATGTSGAATAETTNGAFTICMREQYTIAPVSFVVVVMGTSPAALT